MANGITGLTEPIAIWPADAILSAELRRRIPDPCPGSMNALDLATLVAFDQSAEDETLQALAALLALAYAPELHPGSEGRGSLRSAQPSSSWERR